MAQSAEQIDFFRVFRAFRGLTAAFRIIQILTMARLTGHNEY